MYEYSIMKLTKYFLKEGRSDELGSLMGKMNLAKVQYMHLWTYNNEMPCTINV